MARVSISKAIKLAGVSRSTFYSSYIKQGRVTVSSDDAGKKYIDTSELIRVFGTLQKESPNTPNSSTEHPAEQVRTPTATASNELLIEVGQLRSENKNIKEQLSESREREDWYKKQIDALTDTMKLLEGPKQHPRLWWQFWK